MIPSTAIKGVVLLGIPYAEKPAVWQREECTLPASYLVRIGDKEFTVPYNDWMDWWPDAYPGEPEIGATLDLFVRRTWARANGFAE